MCIISLLMCAKFEGDPIMRLHVMAVSSRCAKKRRRKRKRRKWTAFWRLTFQEQLAQFTSNLVCVLFQYANTCTVNLVLFGQENTELHTCIKSYFVLHVNILTLCTHTPFSWAARHTTVCLDDNYLSFEVACTDY